MEEAKSSELEEAKSSELEEAKSSELEEAKSSELEEAKSSELEEAKSSEREATMGVGTNGFATSTRTGLEATLSRDESWLERRRLPQRTGWSAADSRSALAGAPPTPAAQGEPVAPLRTWRQDSPEMRTALERGWLAQR